MSSEGPFSGILVVDLTRVLAGPYCTMVLSDLGARVIKVEPPDVGDDARHFGPFVKDKSAYFMSLNRGKESIALNLKDDADRKLFDALLEKADVLVENYRPGAMERLGYGWDSLHQRFPRLIYAATSGFGHTGPYSSRPAYDMVIQAMGGIMSVTGQPGGEPTRVGSSIGDITAGLFTAIGIGSALYERTRSGKGMMLDVAMLDCQVAVLENAIARYMASGEVPGPLGARHPSISPFDAFSTSDGHIIIAAGNDNLFRKLCGAIGRSDLADNPLFLTNPLRNQHVDALKDELDTALVDETTEQWLNRLGQAGVPCGPINDVAQVLSDPQVLARNMVVQVLDPDTGPLSMAGNPIKMSAFSDPDRRGAVPDLDGDREAILSLIRESND